MDGYYNKETVAIWKELAALVSPIVSLVCK